MPIPNPTPAHIPDGYHVFLDGNMWCAVGPGFENLQESEAAFDATPLGALAKLLGATATDRLREEACKSALMALCAVRNGLEPAAHPNMIKDIDFAIEGCRGALGLPL